MYFGFANVVQNLRSKNTYTMRLVGGYVFLYVKTKKVGKDFELLQQMFLSYKVIDLHNGAKNWKKIQFGITAVLICLKG